MRTVLSTFLLSCVILQAAAAQSTPRRAGKVAPALPLEEVAIMLSSSDEEELRSALESAASLRAKDVLPLLDERVRTGLTPVLLDVALDTFVLLGDASVGPLLADLARHRRAAVRVRALDVYAQLDPRKAEPAALAALGDLDPAVRKAAADALVKMGAKGAFERLYSAFERDVDGAARALGELAKPSELPRIIGLLEQRSMETLSPLLESLLMRRDLPMADKQRVIDALVSLHSDDARAELERLASTLPREAPPELRKSLAEALASGAKP